MPENKLSTWGVIKVSGPEAAKFLHTQLTNSVENQPDSELRLAGFCTAKGRLLGTFFVVKQNDSIFLVCKRDTITALVKRLTMFKLRSKCEIVDASDAVNLQFVDQTDQAPFTVNGTDNQKLICSLRPLSEQKKPSGFIIDLEADGQADGIESDNEFDRTLWALGIAYVVADTVESFIPQSINFDLVGGIHFEKGCYPGQEVVARSHYIGKVKRRAFLADITEDQQIKAGQDVWMTGKTNEPAGSVVTVSRVAGSTQLMIELVASDALEGKNTFHFEGCADQTFTVTPPPYNVMEKGSQYL